MRGSDIGDVDLPSWVRAVAEDVGYLIAYG